MLGASCERFLLLSLARLQARFLKESSINSKREIFPDIDHIDIQPRGETLRIRGEPVMLQLSLVPAYSLTIHKTQACVLLDKAVRVWI